MSYHDAVKYLWMLNRTDYLEELAYQLIVAIKQLHQWGIRHSDIQPNNIVVYVNDNCQSVKTATKDLIGSNDRPNQSSWVKLFLIDFSSSSSRRKVRSSSITDFFSCKELLEKSWLQYAKVSKTSKSVDIVSVGYLLFMTFTGKNLMQLIYEQIIDCDPKFSSQWENLPRGKLFKWVADLTIMQQDTNQMLEAYEGVGILTQQRIEMIKACIEPSPYERCPVSVLQKDFLEFSEHMGDNF